MPDLTYKFISTDEEWAQVEETYIRSGLTPPAKLISPVVGAFDGDKLTDFLILSPFYQASGVFPSGPEVERKLLNLIDDNLSKFPGAEYYTFVAPGSTRTKEIMEKVPVEVYRRRF